MTKKIMIMIGMVLMVSSMLFPATFDEEKTKTADGETFVFPKDALRSGPAIFALTMGKDRENGSAQQLEVVGWQQFFDENPAVLGDVPVYHFPVLSGVPFFVKGTIRKALYDYYSDVTDPARVGVLFVSKTEKFAKKAGIPSGDESVLVVVAKDSSVVGYVEGGVTPSKVEKLQQIVASL